MCMGERQVHLIAWVRVKYHFIAQKMGKIKYTGGNYLLYSILYVIRIHYSFETEHCNMYMCTLHMFIGGEPERTQMFHEV